MDERDLPIDIQISKLSDWLITRRHVNKDWPHVARKIREKIKAAINDMPEHPDIMKLLSGAYINYYHCQKIVEILRETEKDSKNIFGWYTSQRMKEWQEIVNLYSKNSVYLAEQGQQLTRNIVYEIPSVRKQIVKCIQTQEQCDKTQDECVNKISLSKDRYHAACKQMGIKGQNVERELIEMASAMHETFDEIARVSESLKEAILFYADFVQFTVPSSGLDCLPLINLIIELGDVTVYEWIHKEAPLSIVKPEPDMPLAEDSDEQDEGIDFGDEEIDFGNDEIDFDISCEEPSQEITLGDQVAGSDIVVEASGMEGGVAKGQEALSVLSNLPTRSQFINELLELQGFLKQRKLELESEETLLSMTQFTSAPKRVQHQNATIIQSYLITIQQIITDLTSTKMQHLFLIVASPRYVKRFAETLTSKLKETDKLQSKISDVEQKRQAAIQMQGKLSEDLEVIIKKTLVLQSDMQKEIALKYNNRPVNLMGKVVSKA